MNLAFIPYWNHPWDWNTKGIKSNRKRMEGSNKMKKAFQVDDKKHLKFQTWHAEWIQGKISSLFSLPIWLFHTFSIGFDPPHNSISRIDPIGNEYKVRISYLYRLGLVFSFGAPHLHLYIYMYIKQFVIWNKWPLINFP